MRSDAVRFEKYEHTSRDRMLHDWCRPIPPTVDLTALSLRRRRTSQLALLDTTRPTLLSVCVFCDCLLDNNG